ncbi:MAG: Ornithine cyclodeaminase [Paucimonas sp.]|nr:Ornithine cyclodeaminase [Paucimonas sp.]
MLHITDDMIERLVTPADAEQVMKHAYTSFAHGEAAMQERIRTEAGGVKLSTLGAVIPSLGVAGAKVYTTIAGQFRFVILIFSTEDGRPLASFDAGAITRLRTAACSLLAARSMANAGARQMALFGAGVQGVAHAEQFAKELGLQRILLCDPFAAPDIESRLGEACGIPVVFSTPEEAVRDADIIVTASRSTTPLFAGEWIKPGAFIAAIGSSLPHTRELDDVALTRARHVVVEWRTQAMREAGDIVLAGEGVLAPARILEFGDVVAGRVAPRASAGDILIYKAVGVGLQDVALASLAWERYQQSGTMAA